MERIPMTAAGYKALEDEIQHLKVDERPAVIRMITEARAHGDLSENAEYHAAKERQAFIEGRVMDLEDKLSRAEVIDVSKLSGKTVKFGATVTLADEDNDAFVQPDKLMHLPRLGLEINVYFRGNDKLMVASDILYMDRLGQTGPLPATPPVLEGARMNAIDCALPPGPPVVSKVAG